MVISRTRSATRKGPKAGARVSTTSSSFSCKLTRTCASTIRTHSLLPITSVRITTTSVQVLFTRQCHMQPVSPAIPAPAQITMMPTKLSTSPPTSNGGCHGSSIERLVRFLWQRNWRQVRLDLRFAQLFGRRCYLEWAFLHCAEGMG